MSASLSEAFSVSCSRLNGEAGRTSASLTPLFYTDLGGTLPEQMGAHDSEDRRQAPWPKACERQPTYGLWGCLCAAPACNRAERFVALNNQTKIGSLR